MSITTVGFSPWETIPANTMFRVTIAGHSYDLFDQYPGAVQLLYDQLYPIADFIPTTFLATVNTARSVVVDGLVNHETTGATLINRLDGLAARFAFVSTVQRLTDDEKAQSGGDNGARARTDAEAKAKSAADASSFLHQLSERFNSLGTVTKWVGVLAALLAIVYLVHEFKGARK